MYNIFFNNILILIIHIINYIRYTIRYPLKKPDEIIIINAYIIILNKIEFKYNYIIENKNDTNLISFRHINYNYCRLVVINTIITIVY